MNYLGILFTFGSFLTLVYSSDNPTKRDNLPKILLQELKDCHKYVFFHLFTRNNSDYSQQLLPTKDALNNSSYDPAKENKILIHGFTDNITDPNFVKLRENYLIQGDYNVWMIDWSSVVDSSPSGYAIALPQMPLVGQCIAELVNTILDISQPTIHIVGHSLGAHMAGYISKEMKALKPEYKLDRITGLDAALPCFIDKYPRNRRLNINDARFVDAMHTDATVFGQKDAFADIDYYINEGANQPKCCGDDVCNHNRAVAYFAESITSKLGFYGWTCDYIELCAARQCPPNEHIFLMGDPIDRNATGSYIVPINDVFPYAKGPKFTSNLCTADVDHAFINCGARKKRFPGDIICG